MATQTAARLKKGDELKEEREFLETSFRQTDGGTPGSLSRRLKADDLVRQRVTEATRKELVIVELLLPSLAGRTVTEAECLARLRLGRSAVALEQFRATHGNRYPTTLSELTPEYLSASPADPFDAQPLCY